MTEKICSKIDTCHKIDMLKDKDMLDSQFAEAVREVCGKCDEYESRRQNKMTDRLLTLHKLILKICRDKYAVPEMMADRIIKEVDGHDARTASLVRAEVLELVEDFVTLIGSDFDAKYGVHVDSLGQMKSLPEIIKLRFGIGKPLKRGS